jgi:hypothetical protein
MPTPVFVGQTTNFSNAGTEFPTVAVPAGAAIGDRLVAILTYAGTTATITPPTGWTSHYLAPLQSSGSVSIISRTMATGVTQAQWSMTTGQAAYSKSSMAMVAYREVSALSFGTPVNRTTIINTTTAPQVTVDQASSVILGVFGERVSSQTSATAPTGMTERAKVVQGGGGGTSVLIADEVRAAAGVTGTRTATYAVASDNAAGVIIELSPTSSSTAATVNVGATATSNVNTAFSRTATTTGTITSRQWTQQSGPATLTITGATTATMTATPTIAGVYVFRHTVNGTVFDEFTLNAAGTTARTSGVVTNTGNWVPVAATSLNEAEADESDSSWSESPDGAVGAAYTQTLAPLQPGPVTVATRARVTSGTATLRQELYQGTTLKATWNNALTTTFATYSNTTTTAETSAITDFNDLRIRRVWAS